MCAEGFGVEYLTKQEIIYRELHDGILKKRYLPGERLDLDEIAALADTSRTPVREAVRRLESQGLVTVVPHRGYFVSKLSVSKIIELYHVRSVLEGLAARLAAGRLTAGEIDRLHRLLAEMETASSKRRCDEFLELNWPFHEIIHKAAGSPLLYSYINDLYAATNRFRELALTPAGRIDSVVKEHRELLDAVISGDGDRAERTAKLHNEHNAAAVVETASQLEQS